MKTAMSMIWSAVGVAVALCLALALLGSCSQAPAQTGGQSDGAPGSASATAAQGSSLMEDAAEEDWTALREALQRAQAYDDPAPYTEESWAMLERAKASAQEIMSGYPEGTKTEVGGRTTSLNTSIITLELK